MTTISKSSNHPTDWSTSESNNGMSHNDSSHGGDTPEPPVYVAPDVANREEKAVTRSKFLVFLVLLLVVSGAATATYVLMKQEQSNDFAVAFAGLASEVSTVARQRLDQIFSGLDAYSAFISSDVKADANSSWPFVTIPDYSMKSEKMSELFGFKRSAFLLASLVREDQKENWTSFVLESAPSWYQESLDNEGNKFTVDEFMNVTVPFVHEYNFTDNFNPIPTRTGTSLPVWYKYPLEPTGTGTATTSFDFFSQPSVADLFQFDAHDTQYDDHLESRAILDIDLDEDHLPEGFCLHELTLDLYPTREFEVTFHTIKPLAYTGVVVAIFVFTSLVFLLYDFFVCKRQRKFMDRIVKQDQIVSNVFPTAIRDRLYESGQKGSDQDDLLDPLGGGLGSGAAPLADLFPETTILFADIAGFTAWASAREPAQVFILLETIYGGFDKQAYRHSVFKVETVGDCYVAVAGLPEPDKDHALAVCRFARDCIKTMNDTTLNLEVSLGPDTSDL
eukprot:scaffold2090_cov103-Cylindrotheca_fusiformis.AAC.11